MMLSEEDGETRSGDLLVEPAAEFDVLSIGVPTSTPVMEITYDGGPGLVPRQTSNYTSKRSGGSKGSESFEFQELDTTEISNSNDSDPFDL
jgi:hypothetical protein